MTDNHKTLNDNALFDYLHSLITSSQSYFECEELTPYTEMRLLLSGALSFVTLWENRGWINNKTEDFYARCANPERQFANRGMMVYFTVTQKFLDRHAFKEL